MPKHNHADTFHKYFDQQWTLYNAGVLTQTELSHRVIDEIGNRRLDIVQTFSELPNEGRAVLWEYFTKLHRDNQSVLYTDATTEFDRNFKQSVLELLSKK